MVMRAAVREEKKALESVRGIKGGETNEVKG